MIVIYLKEIMIRYKCRSLQKCFVSVSVFRVHVGLGVYESEDLFTLFAFSFGLLISFCFLLFHFCFILIYFLFILIFT